MTCTAKAVLTVEEAASYLEIGRNTAYRAVRDGSIPSIRIGRIIRVPKKALEDMLDEAAS